MSPSTPICNCVPLRALEILGSNLQSLALPRGLWTLAIEIAEALQNLAQHLSGKRGIGITVHMPNLRIWHLDGWS